MLGRNRTVAEIKRVLLCYCCVSENSCFRNTIVRRLPTEVLQNLSEIYQTKFYCNQTLNTTVTQSGETFLTRSTQKIEAFFQILEIQETQRICGGETSRIAHSCHGMFCLEKSDPNQSNMKNGNHRK